MKILYILQQSIYNNNNKWLTADSNINMMCGMLRELTAKTDWEFYITIAPLNFFADIESYDEIFKHPNVHFIPYWNPVSAFYSRQHFDINDFTSVLNRVDPDIVWNNTAELSRNIKTVLHFESHRAKLITCCYWLDCPEIGQAKVNPSISYDWRQFDGFECSDLAVFTCQSTKDAFLKNAEKKFDGFFSFNITKKSTIWDFGYSQKEIQQYKTDERFEKPTILFLNRLSGINYTHHLEFIDAVNKLAETRDDFQVIFTNPSQKISWEELESKVKNLYIYSKESLTRKEYCELLWKSNISVHLFISELYGGCSNVESIEAENIVITPKINEYRIRLGENYDFYCKDDFSDLTQKLNSALNFYPKILNRDIQIKNRIRSSFEEISDKIIQDIKSLSA